MPKDLALLNRNQVAIQFDESQMTPMTITTPDLYLRPFTSSPQDVELDIQLGNHPQVREKYATGRTLAQITRASATDAFRKLLIDKQKQHCQKSWINETTKQKIKERVTKRLSEWEQKRLNGYPFFGMDVFKKRINRSE